MVYKNVALIIITLLSAYVSCADMQPINVDIPDLEGSYVHPSGKVAAVYLDQPIPFEVGSVSLLLEGSQKQPVA